MTSSNSVDASFKWRHFDRPIIILCIRLPVSNTPRYPELAEMKSEHARHHGKRVTRQVHCPPVGTRSFRLPNDWGMIQRSSASRMSCSNNAPRPPSVIAKPSIPFGVAKPNVRSLPAISIGTGDGRRLASAAAFSLRSHSKSSGIRFGFAALILFRLTRVRKLTDGPVHAEVRGNDQGICILEVGVRFVGGSYKRVPIGHLTAPQPSLSWPPANPQSILQVSAPTVEFS